MKEFRVRVGDFVLGKEERQAVIDVLDSGRLSEGQKVMEFERAWAKFVGTRYCVATSSGSSALIAGLTALKYMKGLRDGMKVITTPLVYVATSNAISVVGLQPVYVDVELETFNIAPQNIRALMSQDDPRDYAVILPVHLMGYAARMDEINAIAKEHGLMVFEDAAQAHGTVYNGQKTGAMSLLSAFSFYIAHNVQAGEMGAVNTDDPEINRLVRKIKVQGRACDCRICVRSTGRCPQLDMGDQDDDLDPRFVHELIGYNFKVMEFQAALGITQLQKVDWILQERRRNVSYLNEHLACYEDLLRLPRYAEEISYLAYPIVIKKPDVISRKELRMRLEEEGVETRPLFGCIPTQQPAYAHLKAHYAGKLPNAEYLGLNAFYIGCHQYLEEEDLEYVVRAFGRILG